MNTDRANAFFYQRALSPWIEHTIATQAATSGTHTVEQLREGIRAMLTQQVKFSLAHDTVHGAAIAELRAIRWPTP
jgi:hypothetical protein